MNSENIMVFCFPSQKYLLRSYYVHGLKTGAPMHYGASTKFRNGDMYCIPEKGLFPSAVSVFLHYEICRSDCHTQLKQAHRTNREAKFLSSSFFILHF